METETILETEIVFLNMISECLSLVQSWWDGVQRIWQQEGAQTAIGWALVSPIWHFSNAAGIDLLSPISESVYESEWDLLIILDACRADLLQEVAEEYDFIDSVDTIYSLGGDSTGWIRENFVRSKYQEQVQDTCYITGNPHTDIVLTGREFKYLDEVWKYAFDYDNGVMPPRPITERAVAVGRQQNCDRLIVHYMQPHFPSLPNLTLGSTMNPKTVGTEWESIWKQLEEGKIEKQVVWAAYRENLRYILDEVELLLENIAADKVVISADHGNAAGELGFYGHQDVPIPAIRKVPWCETTSHDKKTLIPDPKRPDNTTSFDREEQLDALGYK